MTIKVIVLAAGKGTRMKSDKPKVLHHLADKSLLSHVLDTVSTLSPAQIAVVIGHGAEQVQSEIKQPVHWAMQSEQLGTGHAVKQALDIIEDGDTVIVGYGDVPLTQAATFQSLVTTANPSTIALLTLSLEDSTGYGRIVRNSDGHVTGIVEQKDATAEQQQIKEINSGMLAINGAALKKLLGQINNQNAQGEYYLTDIFELGVAEGLSIETVQPEFSWEVTGVNSRQQLAELERIHQQNIASRLMDAGVTLRDPARLDVRGQLDTGNDVEIDINVLFQGHNTLGSDVRIGANCVLINTQVGDGCRVEPNSILENAVLGNNCTIGPYARLRPGSELSDNAKIGNFVEIKNAQIGRGSKVNHLSYVGDSEVGHNVNVGAGTITCNYDGANKHKTVMHDDVFIGSNSALVAPVTIGKGSTVGAGSTISKDVADDTLVVARGRLTEIPGWERPVKKPKQ